MSQLEDLLQECTVKLTLPDRKGWGTGFFVAPEWILTCAHVVQDVGQPVQIQWQKQNLEAVVERSLPDPYDLALLRVTQPINPNPPCVYLDAAIQSRDPLYLFGYPDQDFPNGCPVTFSCEGLTGDEPALIKFALGQVRPGMSGSPLLNQRTGKVCGIVKFTRDRSIDLGGGAIPVSVIWAQLPELVELQQKFHQYNHYWSELLSIAYSFGLEVSKEQYQSAKYDYLKQLANWFDDVKFAGIAVEGQEVERAENLAQIFVMPTVGEEVKPIAVYAGGDRISEASTLSLREFQGRTDRQLQLLQDQQYRSQFSRIGRKFSAQQLLNQKQSKLVLLGAPGSGKTTLMSYFAVMVAKGKTENLGLAISTNWLPILIRVRDWVRQPNLSLTEYARQFAEKTMSVKSLPPDFFEYWLENGKTLILLDGLDEVAEESKRYHTVQCIENFLIQYKQNRAIITSRPASYRRDFFRTEDYPHYELQPFDDGQIEEFTARWYTSRIPDEVEAKRRQDSLRKALHDNDRIKLLARNPLLLTIIALIHRYQAVLPKQRYKLYDKAVATLLIAWDNNKELSNHTVLKYLQLDDLQRLMESLAYWIHTQGSTGDNEGGTVIDREELVRELSKEIKQQKQIELHQAKGEAERFVNFIRDRTGLLNEQGHDCYAFVHKTFQEYLASQDISYQSDNEDDFNIVLDHIDEHLHDPHWREVLLLLIAQQNPKKSARTIRKVLEHSTLYEKWLHRDLLFAGRCLAENPKALTGADPNLVAEVLTQLIKIYLSGSSKVGQSVCSEIFQILSSLHQTDYEAQALKLIKSLEDQIDKVEMQELRAILGEQEEAIDVLLNLLAEEDLELSTASAFALRKLSPTTVTESQLQKLKQLLSNDDFLKRSKPTDDRLYRTTAEVLAKFGRGSEAVQQFLFQLLQSEDSYVRSAGATGLGWYNNASNEVIQKLTDFLNDPNNTSSDHSYGAYALYRLRTFSERILKILLNELLVGEQYWWAVATISYFDEQSKDLKPKLLKMMENPLTRPKAILALGYIGEISKDEIQELIAILKHENQIMRFTAIDALGRTGIKTKDVIEALLFLLQDSTAPNDERFYAAQSLGELGDASDDIVTALLRSLNDDHLSSVAARALGKLGKKSAEIINALVHRIENCHDSKFVGAEIDALWEIFTR